MPFDTDGFDIADTTLGLLLRGRQRVERGWIQGQLGTDVGVCAVGGVTDDNRTGLQADAISYLYRALPWRYRLPGGSRWSNLSRAGNRVAAYNDNPRRTQGEILALYDRAIALYKSNVKVR